MKGTSAPAHEQTVQSGEVRLHVRVKGGDRARQVLVAVHGGPGASHDYLLDLERLASPQRRVVSYDQRGSGRSESPPRRASNYALERFVEDLEAVCRSTGERAVHLLGHSWGGLVALRYAAHDPRGVRSLLLVASSPPYSRALEEGRRAVQARIARLQREGFIPERLPDGAQAYTQAVLPAFFADPSFEAPESIRKMPIDPETMRLASNALGEFDIRARLAALDHRVLVIWGAEDPYRAAFEPALQNALAAARIEVARIAGCGHFWQERPEEFFAAVEGFLAPANGNDA